MSIDLFLRLSTLAIGFAIPLLGAPQSVVNWCLAGSLFLIIVLAVRGTRGQIWNPSVIYTKRSRNLRLEAGRVEANLFICSGALFVGVVGGIVAVMAFGP